MACLNSTRIEGQFIEEFVCVAWVWQRADRRTPRMSRGELADREGTVIPCLLG